MVPLALIAIIQESLEDLCIMAGDALPPHLPRINVFTDLNQCDAPTKMCYMFEKMLCDYFVNGSENGSTKIQTPKNEEEIHVP